MLCCRGGQVRHYWEVLVCSCNRLRPSYRYLEFACFGPKAAQQSPKKHQARDVWSREAVFVLRSKHSSSCGWLGSGR